MLRHLRETKFQAFQQIREAGPVRYPKGHQPGLKVPKGGSMCANCKFLKDPKKRICGEPNFIRWNGSSLIPGNIDEYCSDWYKPRG